MQHIPSSATCSVFLREWTHETFENLISLMSDKNAAVDWQPREIHPFLDFMEVISCVKSV